MGRGRGGGRTTPLSQLSPTRGLERRKQSCNEQEEEPGWEVPPCPALPGAAPIPPWPESRASGLCLLPPGGRRGAYSSQQAGHNDSSHYPGFPKGVGLLISNTWRHSAAVTHLFMFQKA